MKNPTRVFQEKKIRQLHKTNTCQKRSVTFSLLIPCPEMWDMSCKLLSMFISSVKCCESY